MSSPKFLKILQSIGLNHGNAHVKLFQWHIFGLGAIGKSLSLIWPFFSPFLAKNTFFHLMSSPKFLKILQRIGLNHGNAHVKLFQWYIFGLGAIDKSLSLIRPIFHFPIIFLIILSRDLLSNVHVHMLIVGASIY